MNVKTIYIVIFLFCLHNLIVAFPYFLFPHKGATSPLYVGLFISLLKNVCV